MRLKCIKRGILVEAIVFFLLPMAQLALYEPLVRAGYTAILLPLMLYPLCCFITGFVVGILSGFAWQLVLLTATLFIPAALTFYGEAGLPYAAIYGGVSLMGLVTAYPIWHMKKSRQTEA